MSPADVKARVAKIAATHCKDGKWDHEGAHAMEDVLWRDVLRAIAAGAPDAQALAVEAIRTEELDFTRVYA